MAFSKLSLIALLALPLLSQAETAEEAEAARIQIQTGSKASGIEEVRLFPADGGAKPALSAWGGCKAELGGDSLTMSATSGTTPWAGFKMTVSNSLKMDSAQAFNATQLSFKMKTSGKATLQNLQICVAGFDAQGKEATSAFRPLPKTLPGESATWLDVSLRLKDFSGSDKLRSLNGVVFQFMGPAPEGSFQIGSARLERKLSKTVSTKFEIEKIDLSALETSKEKFPASATNIFIAGPDIVRDGKPVFLTGAEDSAIYFPWLYKLMEFDIIQLQDFSTAEQMKWKIEGDTVKVTWPPLNEWFETKLRRLLANGFAIHVNNWDGASRDKAFQERFSDALAETSHFYTWRLDDPLGRAIKENYTKGLNRTLAKYPVTFYELYNEVVYGDNSPASIAAFQKEMKAKYPSLAAANKAWGTDFQSFEAIVPPRKKATWSVFRSGLEPQPMPVELYVEWQRFIERWFGAELRKLTASIKKDFKHPNSYVIYQSVMNLHQDFSGFSNTYPKELLSAEDALCHEGGMVFYPQAKGAESDGDIAKMTRSLMVWDFLKGLSPVKPIYLSECGIHSVAPTFDKASALLDLDGPWRFADGSELDGVALGFQKPDFNDASWASVNAPGVWGSQGFPKCTVGWYRRTFTAPASPSGKFFLTGKELADRACLYLNGKLIHETIAWNDAFSVDVTNLLKPGVNTLALSIANKYEVEGQVQGGIRDFLALTDRQFFKTAKLTAGQMRAWFWSMAVHDVSGVSMSYFYTSATNKDLQPIYSPILKDYEAVRAIPEVKREIDNVAETLLPRPRLKGEVAFVYPFETGRARLAENNADLYTGKVTLALMEYYLSALFSQLTPEVTTCDAILDGSADKFKVLVLPASTRVQGGVPAHLERFVANGGVLVLGPGAMSFDDDAHTSIPSPEWLGIKVGKPLSNPKMVNGVQTARRAFDSSYGVELELAGAEPLTKFDDGTPAITRNRHGKGWVYYYACNLAFPQLKKSLASLLMTHGVKPQLVLSPLDGSPANYVEAHILGAKDRFVCYLNNFGAGDRKLKVAWPDAAEGVFKLSDIRTGKVLKESLDAKTLRNGIEVLATSQDPVTLLLERKGAGKETSLAQLPDANKRFLDMWRQSPQGQVKVLFSSCFRDEVDPFRMLTGKRLLEDHGFELSYGMDLPKEGKVKAYLSDAELKPLSDFAIYVLPGPMNGFTAKDAAALKELVDYARNGGSVLLCGTANVGYFNWMSNLNKRKALFDAFGLKCTDVNFRDERENNGFSPTFCKFTNIVKGHPVTLGVESVQLAEASALGKAAKDQTALISSNATSVPAQAPFLIAMEFGKGRVVAMGDAQWMQPEWLDKADNAQLLLNIFNWLAHKDAVVVPKDELKAAVDSKLGVQ